MIMMPSNRARTFDASPARDRLAATDQTPLEPQGMSHNHGYRYHHCTTTNVEPQLFPPSDTVGLNFNPSMSGVWHPFNPSWTYDNTLASSAEGIWNASSSHQGHSNTFPSSPESGWPSNELDSRRGSVDTLGSTSATSSRSSAPSLGLSPRSSPQSSPPCTGQTGKRKDSNPSSDPCPYCGDRFAENSTLKRHIDKLHELTKSFCCIFCSDMFRFTEGSDKVICVLCPGPPLIPAKEAISHIYKLHYSRLSSPSTQFVKRSDDLRNKHLDADDHVVLKEALCCSNDPRKPEEHLKLPALDLRATISCSHCDKLFEGKVEFLDHVSKAKKQGRAQQIEGDPYFFTRQVMKLLWRDVMRDAWMRCLLKRVPEGVHVSWQPWGEGPSTLLRELEIVGLAGRPADAPSPDQLANMALDLWQTQIWEEQQKQAGGLQAMSMQGRM